jgi:hypothetical protein
MGFKIEAHVVREASVTNILYVKWIIFSLYTSTRSLVSIITRGGAMFAAATRRSKTHVHDV